MKLSHIAVRDGRLSSFLQEEMAMSLGLINRLKWHDKILVNDQPQHTDHPVKIGDRITILLDEPTPDYPPEDGDLTVLYEDDYILVVDKPAGMLIHPSRARFTGTLANFVLGYYEKTGQKSAFHPLTRLDRDTFGVVLLAKNSYIHARLSQTAIQKTYEAMVYGQVEDQTIDAPIARRPLPSLLRYIAPEGKPSVTVLKLLKQHPTHSLVALTPITGRTHQLRLHCAHIGHPILGDPQYGNPASMKLSSQWGLTHQQLCARSLEFDHPITGEHLRLISQISMNGTQGLQ